MKLISIIALGGILASALQLSAADPKPLATQKEKASYGVGMNVGKRFKHDLIELDIDAFARGFKDALAGAKPALTPEELETAMETLKKEVEQRAAGLAATNQKVGEDFLAKNKSEAGVKTTSTGLQYKITKEGSGASPKPTDTVKVHYKGTLIDGTEFDSSYSRNEPAEFPLNGVIPGWTEGLQLLKPGGKARLYIPSKLAYGEQSQPPIPPNSVLIFDVELLSIAADSK